MTFSFRTVYGPQRVFCTLCYLYYPAMNGPPLSRLHPYSFIDWFGRWADSIISTRALSSLYCFERHHQYHYCCHLVHPARNYGHNLMHMNVYKKCMCTMHNKCPYVQYDVNNMGPITFCTDLDVGPIFITPHFKIV